MIYSLAFPDMFTSSRTNVIEDKDATINNLRLLLLSSKKSLFGDPYFGTNLKQVLFTQNGAIIRDLIIDEIYTAITIFMPQLSVKRDNIEIYADNLDIYAKFQATNLLDYSLNLYNIKLTNNELQE